MKAVILVLVVLLGIGLIVGSMYVDRKNQMVTKNETVKSTWAEVDVVLQRRADLIPNLVATVQGYAAQEQTVFHDIAAARSALIGAGSPQAQRIQIARQMDLPAKMAMAKRLAGIVPDGEEELP